MGREQWGEVGGKRRWEGGSEDSGNVRWILNGSTSDNSVERIGEWENVGVRESGIEWGGDAQCTTHNGCAVWVCRLSLLLCCLSLLFEFAV